jgi:alanine-synthesizing transaminase
MNGAEHKSTASFVPGHPAVTFNGLSKSHSMCGYRCGWMAVSGEKKGLADYLEGLNVLASMRLCSNVPSQTLIKASLDEPDYATELYFPGGRLYEQCETATEMINGIPGLSVVKPKAAMYMFPKMDIEMLGITDDERFVLDFLQSEHVLLTHGRSFNWPEPDHFRLVYLPEVPVLRDVLGRLKSFLSSYSQI